MPTSDHHNINTILTILTRLGPQRVLDIGCGFGKYGVLLREYLDIWKGRLEPQDWRLTLVGIEAFSHYRNPIHDFVYSTVHYGEAQKILPKLGEFDVILMADVIEHLEKPQALQLVIECFAHSPVVIISTPIGFYPQGEICGNPHEIHRSLWTQIDFPPDVIVRSVHMVSCVIFVASRQTLNSAIFALTDPVDYVYLRSRKKLGNPGWPLSAGLRLLCRWLA